MKAALQLLPGLIVSALFAALAGAQEPEHDHDHDHGHDSAAGAGIHTPGSLEPGRIAPWPGELVEAFERLPVQDQGRVKPLSTYAGFTLLRLNGKRSVETHTGERLSPTEWLLDVLLIPHQAAKYEVFSVADSAAVQALELDVSGKQKRDRWSFDELRPAVPRLFDLTHEWGRIDAKQRTAVQEQVVALGQAVDTFMGLAGYLDFAHAEFARPPGERFVELFGDVPRVRFSDVVEHGSALRTLYDGLAGSTDALERESYLALDALLRTASDVSRSSSGLAMIPPVGAIDGAPVWTTPAELYGDALAREPAAPDQVAYLRALEAFADATHRPSELAATVGRMASAADGLAGPRGDARKVGLEVAYYDAKPLRWGLACFLLAFVAAAVLWLRPKARLPYWAVNGATAAGFVALVGAIVARCVIRGRPPVSTLYETVLFVTAVAVFLGLATEWIGRKRVAVSSAALIGAIGLFLANGYETFDKQDTMPALVAVLDTNFWLATHVTTITIGYAAGMFAALLGSVYLLGRLFFGQRLSRDFYRGTSRMVYGTICFGLLFSIVGTILGGIWANDSWGRFWGWDPKENGALLICLTQAAILHGRLSGLLKEHGICALAAFGGTVVAFSWWGVNLLGVGLHSYGFTRGIQNALWTYYGLQWGVVLLGAVAWWRDSLVAKAKAEAARTTTQGPRPAAGEAADAA
ncbi:MAG: cytochrome c biogenesis protein CcsA [Planctomycetota bacterium]